MNECEGIQSSKLKSKEKHGRSWTTMDTKSIHATMKTKLERKDIFYSNYSLFVH